mgnify:CR=1 FL=1
MSLKNDILKKAKEIRDTNFTKTNATSVPTISNNKLTFGCTGLTFPATVLYIDMRGSTKVLNIHQRRVVAKIHMTYYHAIVKVAKADGGEIRSFNGDSLLVFFYGTTAEVANKAVRSAMRMQYAITQIINEALKDYTDIDFGIGIDCGDILATKVGLGGTDETKDLIWIGNAVNRSTKISDECKSPKFIGISDAVYKKLDDSLLVYTAKDRWGFDQKHYVWSSCNMVYNDQWETMYQTNCHIVFD